MGTVASSVHKDGEEIERTYPGREITDDYMAQEENRLVREMIEEECLWALPLSILRPDRRMAAQQACFVCSGKLGVNPPVIEQMLCQPAPRRGITATDEGVRFVDRPPGHVIKKIKLPHAWRSQALVSLAKMNITAETLFPDLGGVGRATETYVQNIAPVSLRDHLGF